MQELTDYSVLEGLDLKYKDYNHHFVTKDGFLVGIDKREPSIERVLWEADQDWTTGEYRTSDDIAPNKEALKECFLAHNRRKFHSVIDWLDQHPCGKLFISKGGRYIRDSKVRAIVTSFDEPEENTYNYERELTDDEIKVLRETIEADRQAFEKRLERYWKRYSDKVYISTYWADR